MNKTEKIIDSFTRYVIPCYTRNPLVIVRGKGSRVWDSSGKEYLDFFPGWGVGSMGHCHPKIVKAVKKQVGKLIHIPNNYYNELQAELARLLVKYSFPGKCFFCNSGAEANESAIKLARKHGNQSGRYEIITCDNSFHGRTLATVTATGQEKYRQGFQPLVPGFKYVPFGDITALRQTVTSQTAAVLIEPIQGEGGIQTALREYFHQLRILCNEQKILLIFDEVQTGFGRTGKMFCYQHFDIKPDIITLAKALGGGLPIGAIIAASHISDVLTPGSHASTFGGSPLVCSAAISVIETIINNSLLVRAQKLGDFLQRRLLDLEEKFPRLIKEVRGIGLMWGLELYRPCAAVVEECMQKGLLLNCTHKKVIRIMPALTVTRSQIKQGLKILAGVLGKSA